MSGSLLVPFPGQPDIYLEIHDLDADDRVVFVAPHQTERVMNQALIEMVPNSRARFVVIRQSGTRNLRLDIRDHEVWVDPNRIYTPCGAEASVFDLNEDMNDLDIMAQAAEMAYEVGKFVTRYLRSETEVVWVALHNNTEGYDDDGHGGIGTVSILRYLDRLNWGAKYLTQVTVGPMDEDDLFWTTHSDDHDWLKWSGFNAVHQNPAVATIEDEDDGSLSVFAEMRQVRYFNIEAERFDPETGKGVDHRYSQGLMLDAVLRLIGGIHD